MPEIEIADLFRQSRFPSGLKLFTVILYTPLGCALTIIRFFICIQAVLAASLFPYVSKLRSGVLRAMCCVLGIVVQQEHTEKRDPTVRIIVTNHITSFDHLAVHLVSGCVLPVSTSVTYQLPQLIGSALGLVDFGQGSALTTNVCQYIAPDKEPVPVLVHPEEATTNGTCGLLKFDKWPFTLNNPVQPVVIRLWRPALVDMAPTVLRSNVLIDLLWLLFTPLTVFSLKYLPVMSCGSEEDEVQFCERVRKAMAEELNVMPTKFTRADKVEYVKRVFFRPPPPPATPPRITTARNTATANPELLRMAKQVKDVLPYVPMDVIRRDLVRTRNVDLTITNILEGLIPYVPEPQQMQPTTSTKIETPATQPSTSDSPRSEACSSSPEKLLKTITKSCLENSSVTLDTSASTFAKSAQDRMLSFQERKARLIDNARRKYIEKHGLKIAGYNS